jgi:hypothetical protein
MAQTYVFQDQITGSFISEINDDVNLTVGSSTLLDDLNGLRTQIRKVLHPAGSWTDIPELDLYEINSRFTGSITLNHVTSSFLSVTDDLNVEGNSSIIGDLAVIGETTVISDLTAQSNFYVSGDSEFAGNVVGLNDASVFGNFSVLSDVDVSGNSYFHSDLSVSGSAEIAGSLVVMTDLSTLGNLSILSESDIFGDIRAYSNLFASGTVTALTGFSGSLTRLSDGSPAFLAGSGITISSSSNGAVMISASVSGNTAKGYISGRSSFIDSETGIVTFGPMGANIGTLSDVSDEVIDVYLNGVFLAYGHDIAEITSTTFTLVSYLRESLQSDDIISIVLRST